MGGTGHDKPAGDQRHGLSPSEPPLEGESRRTETDGQGRFAFFDLSNGPYTIELAQGAGPADSAGQMPSLAPRTQLVRPLMLASGEEREVVLRVGEVTARGRLLRGTTPAAGTLYFSRGAAGLGVTRVAHVGPDGQYELQGLDSGAWLVTLRAIAVNMRAKVSSFPPSPCGNGIFSPRRTGCGARADRRLDAGCRGQCRVQPCVRPSIPRLHGPARSQEPHQERWILCAGTFAAGHVHGSGFSHPPWALETPDLDYGSPSRRFRAHRNRTIMLLAPRHCARWPLASKPASRSARPSSCSMTRQGALGGLLPAMMRESLLWRALLPAPIACMSAPQAIPPDEQEIPLREGEIRGNCVSTRHSRGPSGIRRGHYGQASPTDANSGSASRLSGTRHRARRDNR